MKLSHLATFLALLPSLTSCGGEDPTAAAKTPTEASPNPVRRVVLDARQQQSLAIQSAIAGPATVDRRITLPASVHASPHRTVHMTPRVPGVITTLHARLGIKVRRGMPLLELDSVHIGEAARDYLRAIEILQSAQQTLEEEGRLLERQLTKENSVLERGIAVAQQIYDREEELKKQQVSTLRPFLEAQRRLEEAKLARETKLTGLEIARDRRLLQLQVALRQATIEEHAAHNKLHSLGLSDERITTLRSQEPMQLGSYTVRSPMDGVLVRAHVALNEYVTEEQVLFEIQNLDEVWVTAAVFEKDLTQITVGNPLRVRLQAHGERDFEGKVDYLDYIVDPETRTARIRAVFTNAAIEGWPDQFPLRPGMFGTAYVSTGERALPVAVPITAIVHEGERTFVFVREAPGVWVRTPVRVNRGSDQHAEITGGIDAGAVIATSSLFTLKSLARSSEIGEGDG